MEMNNMSLGFQNLEDYGDSNVEPDFSTSLDQGGTGSAPNIKHHQNLST